ncbi:hypothetical protein HB816_13740 [Listeria booriae]|uniref:Uncharacterized protein n=1 Tax=Listeria booriae TaxID=1552123 RepID=A0A841WEU0_9LIST|nr:hypothetical protein [Listeria booriae]MBC1231512.1 hypothetical protein [Listeria booriae]MBC1316622.1 hypothetical protein [Listeria booriae]
MKQNEESRYEREKRQLAMITGCYKIDKQEIVVEKNHLNLLIKLANERNELLHERENAEVVYKFNTKSDGVRDEFSRENAQSHRVILSRDDLTPRYGQKGVWIPVEEAE